jgi:hypothetical protein
VRFETVAKNFRDVRIVLNDQNRSGHLSPFRCNRTFQRGPGDMELRFSMRPVSYRDVNRRLIRCEVIQPVT